MNCQRFSLKPFLVSALFLSLLSLGLAEPRRAFAGPEARPLAANYESAACKSFLNGLTNKLNNKWYIPDGKNKVTITCKLESDGTTQDVNTTSSPSSADAEQAANTAFVQAQPFGSLPTSAGETVKLTLEFISSADPHGDSSRHINAVLSDPKK